MNNKTTVAPLTYLLAQITGSHQVLPNTVTV